MKVDSILNSQQIGLISKNNLLQNLKIGDMINAKVINISDGRIFFQSSNGINFSAISMKLSTVANGDTVNLQVEGKENGQILVKISYRSTIQSNQQIIQQLVNKNIIPNKINIDKAVFIINNNLEINKTNTNFLNKLITHKELLVDDINKLMVLFGEVPEADNTKILYKFKQELNNLILHIDEGLKDKLTENKERLIKLINSISSYLVNSDFNSKEELFKTLNNIKESINFSESLNSIVNFTQLPLNINGKDTTGELYVFKDKKTKKINQNNTSIFISLDTSNLGRIDTYINIINKSIDCTFSSQEKEVIKYIKKNILPLYKLIEASGYKLVNADFKILDKPGCILDIEQLNSRNSITNYDIRV